MVLRSAVLKAFSMASKEVADIPTCAFCTIMNENDSSKIIYQDDEVVAFPDIKPASDRHFLVIPRSHIPNPKILDSSQKALDGHTKVKQTIRIQDTIVKEGSIVDFNIRNTDVEHMIQVGKDLLKEHDPELSDSRFGFHWPPFNTISHLHLHAINPVSKMNFMSKMIFKPESYWFVSPDYVLSRL